MTAALQWVVFIGACLLARWIYDRLQRRERRHTPRTRALLDISTPVFKPVEEVRFMPGGDVVPEGLGGGIVRRPHSPTTPLAYLPEQEWQLWTTVIQESAR